jgi:hypothetical protein
MTKMQDAGTYMNSTVSPVIEDLIYRAEAAAPNDMRLWILQQCEGKDDQFGTPVASGQPCK